MNITATPKPPRCGLALASLILGICSYITCGLTIIPAIICGILALSRIKASNGALGGRNQAIAGIIVGATAPILLAIIGLIASLAIPTFAKTRSHAQAMRARADMAQIETALNYFEVEYACFPEGRDGLNALVIQPPNMPNWRGPFLKGDSVPLDPWGHPYVYDCPGRHNPTKFDLMSMGPDGRAGTGDDIANWDPINR